MGSLKPTVAWHKPTPTKLVGQKIKGSGRAARLSPLWLGVLRGWRRARRDCRVAWRTIVNRLPKISSHRTPRWRKQDSNPGSPETMLPAKTSFSLQFHPHRIREVLDLLGTAFDSGAAG
jgi:hypothetical protein